MNPDIVRAALDGFLFGAGLIIAFGALMQIWAQAKMFTGPVASCGGCPDGTFPPTGK